MPSELDAVKAIGARFAFPVPLPDIMVAPDQAVALLRQHSGMTLREFAAIAAMQGLMARDIGNQTSFHGFAMDAVECADALLAALAHEPTP